MNLIPYMETLTIQNKDSKVFERWDPSAPFAWSQLALCRAVEQMYDRGEPVRIIVLKARQLGISTVSEGILFNWMFMHPGSQGLVIAHENDASQSLFEKSQIFWDNWPFKPLYDIKYATQKRLSWDNIHSSLRIATARNAQSGRSRTLHAVHASECAFWEDPEQLMVGLRQSIPNKHGTIFIAESTANGVGNWFHKTWTDAVRGENEFLPLFFCWWRHPEYRLPVYTVHERNLDDDERELLRLGATMEALEWRRYAIPNLSQGNIDAFRQEYPSTPREAFLTSGNNVFPLESLERKCYRPQRGARGYLVDLEDGSVRFVEDPSGSFTIFKWPSRDRSYGSYFVGGDPSRTTMGDGACIQCINRTTFEQVAVWHGKCNPIDFAHHMARLGHFYNTAELSPEIEGPGYATIGALVEMGYPNLWRHRWADKHQGKLSVSIGWSSNYQRKHWAIGRLTSLIADGSLTIHDHETYNQLCNYVVLENGNMGNSSEWDYDDAVMALAIAVICTITEGPVPIPGPELPPSDIMDIPPWQAWDREAG
jgi:hypothetical protein